MASRLRVSGSARKSESDSIVVLIVTAFTSCMIAESCVCGSAFLSDRLDFLAMVCSALRKAALRSCHCWWISWVTHSCFLQSLRSSRASLSEIKPAATDHCTNELNYAAV